MPDPALIGVDWGTSSFRAMRLDAAGNVLERRAVPRGILTVTDDDFGAVLGSQIADWLRSDAVPVLMSGMIGSRQGWIEVPYLPSPVSLADLAGSLARVSFNHTDVRIVPGLVTSTGTMRDVMRGEETQVFGALARIGATDGRFLLPGTHSKWVVAEAGRIAGFSTYMTGEVYAAARAHTILGRLMESGEPSGAEFGRGVREGARAGGPGALLNRLFGVRTAGLFGEIAGRDLPDYLSGLLIGAEIADAGGQDRGPVRIVASDALAERYRAAAHALGLAAEIVPADCIIDGYVAIAKLAGLIPAR